MYTYGWFMLRFDKKQQNYVKQLSFNKKLIKKYVIGKNAYYHLGLQQVIFSVQ